jgi:hypothetical protein
MLVLRDIVTVLVLVLMLAPVANVVRVFVTLLTVVVGLWRFLVGILLGTFIGIFVRIDL